MDSTSLTEEVALSDGGYLQYPFPIPPRTADRQVAQEHDDSAVKLRETLRIQAAAHENLITEFLKSAQDNTWTISKVERDQFEDMFVYASPSTENIDRELAFTPSLQAERLGIVKGLISEFSLKLSLPSNPWFELEAEARRGLFQRYEERYMRVFVDHHGENLQSGPSSLFRKYDPETGSTILTRDFALSTLRAARWDEETRGLTGTPDHDQGTMTTKLRPPTCVVYTCKSLDNSFSGTFVHFCSEGDDNCTLFQELSNGGKVWPTEIDTNSMH